MAVKVLYVPVSYSTEKMQIELLKREGKLEAFYAQREADANEACVDLDHHLKDGWSILSEQKLDLSSGCKISFVLFHPSPPEGTAIKPKEHQP